MMVPRAKLTNWNVSGLMYGSPSRKKACRTRLFYSGREKQYKSYYSLRRHRYEKALSSASEVRTRESVWLSSWVGEGRTIKGEDDGNEEATRRCPLVDDRHCSPSRLHAEWIHLHVHSSKRARPRVYVHACYSSSRTIPHPRGYSRWQRLIILRKVHPPIIAGRRRRRHTSALLWILRCYVIITDNPRRFLTDTLHAHLLLDNAMVFLWWKAMRHHFVARALLAGALRAYHTHDVSDSL